MKLDFDCYECVFNQVRRIAAGAGSDPDRRRRVADELLGILLRDGSRITPPELMTRFAAVQRRETGVDDPFAEIKRRSTGLGLQLLPELRRMAEAAADPFAAAVKLAIGGNIIDYGVNPDFRLEEAADRIREVLDAPVDTAAIDALRRRMEQAGRIFYVLDNCGEAVIDHLLIGRFSDKITIGVRGGAILNDVTRTDAAASGFGGFRIVDTGDRTPGISLTGSSPEFLAELRNSDLVVCKGQGNFESLEDCFDRPAFFLLRVKCAVVSRRLGLPVGALCVAGRNLK